MSRSFPFLKGQMQRPPSPLGRLLWAQIIQLFHSFCSPKPTFLHSKSWHKETFIFLVPQFHIVQVGQNLNLKTSVVITGIFLNIGSKTNVAGALCKKYLEIGLWYHFQGYTKNKEDGKASTQLKGWSNTTAQRGGYEQKLIPSSRGLQPHL